MVAEGLGRAPMPLRAYPKRTIDLRIAKKMVQPLLIHILCHWSGPVGARQLRATALHRRVPLAHLVYIVVYNPISGQNVVCLYTRTRTHKHTGKQTNTHTLTTAIPQ